MNATSLAQQYHWIKEAASLFHGRLARYRGVRMAVRRCHESLRELSHPALARSGERERLAADIELLRTAIGLFRVQPPPLLDLYERVKWFMAETRPSDMEDFDLPQAFGLMEEALQKWRYLIPALSPLARYPTAMPPYETLFEQEWKLKAQSQGSSRFAWLRRWRSPGRWARALQRINHRHGYREWPRTAPWKREAEKRGSQRECQDSLLERLEPVGGTSPKATLTDDTEPKSPPE